MNQGCFIAEEKPAKSLRSLTNGRVSFTRGIAIALYEQAKNSQTVLSPQLFGT
jgi:hypothetical protein